MGKRSVQGWKHLSAPLRRVKWMMEKRNMENGTLAGPTNSLHAGLGT